MGKTGQVYDFCTTHVGVDVVQLCLPSQTKGDNGIHRGALQLWHLKLSQRCRCGVVVVISESFFPDFESEVDKEFLLVSWCLAMH